ncbi:tautomerase family protein, partial [Streptomyces vinaceusdrappus]
NDRAVRAELVAELTRTTARVAGCPREAVTVLVRDVPRGHWATGGVLADEPADRPAGTR